MIQASVVSAAGVARYGYIHRNLFSADAHSDAEAEQEALQWLAAVAVPERSLTITIDDDPLLKRGDAMWISIPSFGVRRLVWVTSASHRGSGGRATMDVELTFFDPYSSGAYVDPSTGDVTFGALGRRLRILNLLTDDPSQSSSTASSTDAVSPAPAPTTPSSVFRAPAAPGTPVGDALTTKAAA